VLLQPEILHQALRSKEKNEASQLAEQDILTERETEVLEMVADGARNKEIAYKLKITERTVKAHLSHIYQKLAVDSRAAAVAEAAKRGWL
jgi:DNA-binding NarL/FixJ family response regulator